MKQYPVNIDVYVMMRDESFLVKYFLRHYEQFARKIFVWDDLSEDGTTEILRAHPKVELISMPFHGLDDDYSRLNFFPLYKKHSRGKAHWVLAVDSDEFIYHDRLMEILFLYKDKYELITPIGYTMIAKGPPTTDGQIYDEIKTGVRDRLLSKPVIHSPAIDIIFCPGRHYIESIGYPDDPRPPRKRWKTGIKCLHYRHFGDDYYMERLKRNCERLAAGGALYKETHPEAYRRIRGPYKRNMKFRMPDSTRDFPRRWLENNRNKVQQVID